MIRRRDGNGVDILAFEQLSDVAVGIDLRAFFLQLLHFAIEHQLVDVAQGGEAHALAPAETGNVITAAASKTDHRNSNLVAGANVLREGWKGDVNRSGG